MPSGHTGKAISVEELIALNDEIIGLIRAGIPLELGLKEQSRDMPSGISRISLRLATRLSRGESLSEALAAPDEHFPAVYRTIVEAGQRAGSLSSALEEVSRYGRQLLDLRRKIGLALLYPAIVVSMAYGIFVVFLFHLVGRFQDSYAAHRLPVHGALQFLIAARESFELWGWILPCIVLLLAAWWFMSSNSRSLMQESFANPLDWIPQFARLKRNFQWASFADLLALLIDQSVPLPEALGLAGEAIGGAPLRMAAHNLAGSLERGTVAAKGDSHDPNFPPFLRWLIAHDPRQGALANVVRKAGDAYRSRATTQADWLTLVFPIAITVAVGGTATLLYALSFGLPFIGLLKDLNAEPRLIY